jgi:hypothetical protein
LELVRINRFKVDYISEPGSIVNEDSVYAKENYGWIFDGATGLSEVKLTSDETDARWYVRAWDEYLEKSLEPSEESLKWITEKGVEKVKKLFLNEAKRKDINKLDLPSASAGLYRIREDAFEFLLMGDICLVIEDIEGNIQVIKDTKLEALDNIAINELRGLMLNEGLSFKEARESIQELLIRNRLLKNTKKGYWTLEFEKKAVDYCIYDKLPLELINRALFMTDGFYAINTSYKYFSMKDLIAFIDREGLGKLYKKIRNIEDEDRECIKYPRFKKGDDASAIYLKSV